MHRIYDTDTGFAVFGWTLEKQTFVGMSMEILFYPGLAYERLCCIDKLWCNWFSC